MDAFPFSGQNCETDVDECAGNPCRNGGTCSDGINNFTCSCPPTHMGRTCELAYDPCTETEGDAPKCRNGGECKKTKDVRDPGNDFYCECLEGNE